MDEIQACPRAITGLKYFCENQPDLHAIAAGSLLNVVIGKEHISFTVGKVNRMMMYPMSFDEFVCADGGEHLIAALRKMEPDREIPDAYAVPLIRYLKLYYVIGGMPEVVRQWVETYNMEGVTEKQDEILMDYANDFGKHAPTAELPKIRMIWESIPSQLVKDNHKFIFLHVKSGCRAKELEKAVRWLVDAGLIYQLYLVERPEIPLSGEADYTSYKVYMADCGLLRRRSNVHYRTILDGNEQFIHDKGALTENYVLSQLKTLRVNAWCWTSSANAEIDFLTDKEGKITPIEVKSEDNTKAKSLRLFCERYYPERALKTSLKNVRMNLTASTEVWSLPLYALFTIEKYLNNENRKEE